MATQDHCVTDRPTPENSAQPSGEISKIADIDVGQSAYREIDFTEMLRCEVARFTFRNPAIIHICHANFCFFSAVDRESIPRTIRYRRINMLVKGFW